jgi:IS5 family transposase
MFFKQSAPKLKKSENPGLMHSLHTTPANESDVVHAHELLHGQETHVHMDAGYVGVEKRQEIKQALQQQEIRADVQWHVARKRSKIKTMADGALKELILAAERVKAQIRARVKHPFHVVKNLFHYKKARYRGLAKNTAQLFSLFGLANLVIVRNKLVMP